MFFGERFGVISPRASYIRRVCGCISASSAATEIMNTPRRRSSPADPLAGVRGRLGALLAAAHLARPTFADVADASRSSRSRGSWSFIASANALERPLLLAG